MPQGMTLDKAIEIQRLDRTGNFEGDPGDLCQAQQWGLEALERLKEMRGYRTLIGLASSNPGRLLPSEVANQETQKRLETKTQ